MKYCRLILMLIIVISPSLVRCQASADSTKLRQLFSAKFGFYSPSSQLNNGLILGVDGITEFMRHNFFLSLGAEVYPKKTFDFFTAPGPTVNDQQIYLIPIHANFGYKLMDVTDSDTRGYFGGGVGYYLYFYSVDYQSGSGGLFPSVTPKSETRNGGKFFVTLFTRVIIGKIFIEPRYYAASEIVDQVGGYQYTVNPTGFSVSLGYEYH